MSSPMVADESRHVADRDTLERGFRHLRPEQRAILVLHYYLGLPASALAETLQIPQGTAQSRLYRALSDLRVALEADARSAGSSGKRWSHEPFRRTRTRPDRLVRRDGHAAPT
jgi:DNA-directed RNA polymerase specialized sigma24 family protein